MDTIVVVSACPQDIVPINDRNPTSIAIELLGESDGGVHDGVVIGGGLSAGCPPPRTSRSPASTS